MIARNETIDALLAVIHEYQADLDQPGAICSKHQKRFIWITRMHSVGAVLTTARLRLTRYLWAKSHVSNSTSQGNTTEKSYVTESYSCRTI